MQMAVSGMSHVSNGSLLLTRRPWVLCEQKSRLWYALEEVMSVVAHAGCRNGSRDIDMLLHTLILMPVNYQREATKSSSSWNSALVRSSVLSCGLLVGGGLIDFMNTRLQDRLIESEILKIFADVAQGVACMHYLQPPLLHRDIKVGVPSENLVLTAGRKCSHCFFPMLQAL